MSYKRQGLILAVIVFALLFGGSFVQIWYDRYNIWEQKQIEKYCPDCVWLGENGYAGLTLEEMHQKCEAESGTSYYYNTTCGLALGGLYLYSLSFGVF
jgi:hypothetical protein